VDHLSLSSVITDDELSNNNVASAKWLHKISFKDVSIKIENRLPKSEHVASDFGVIVVKSISTNSSPSTVVVDFKTSGIMRSVDTATSKSYCN